MIPRRAWPALGFCAWLVAATAHGAGVPVVVSGSMAVTGQLGGTSEAKRLKLAEPKAHQVFQRDSEDRANIPVKLDADEKGKIVSATITRRDAATDARIASIKYENGMLVGVPTGGPYTITVMARDGEGSSGTMINPVFVGDLWLLAGQSNMQGVGDLADVTPPNDRVMLLGMDGEWEQAREPLHWLVDSPDPVHSGDPATRAKRSEEEHKTRKKGAGLGLPFAVAMVEATGVPVGLIATAHGGTSMEQWDPAKKDQSGTSLYASMMDQFHRAGGKVKGVLWYQGEAEANEKNSSVYSRVFPEFIEALRKDYGQPELPFYFVQIGRFVQSGDSKYWNAVQDIQRKLPDRVANTAVISVVDLELDDLIHVGTQGLKRAGKRLAKVALHNTFGWPGGTTPTFDSVAAGPNNTLVVRFKGVNFQGPDQGPAAGTVSVGGGIAIMTAPNGSSAEHAAGLRPRRHVAGFSIRKDDGSEIPLIYEAMVGPSGDTVVLKLVRKPPEGAKLWYGWGYDPYCNLTDSADMAVPVFGPISLDDLS